MNELELLHDFRAGVPVPDAAQLAAGRARLLAAISSPVESGRRAGRRAPSSPHHLSRPRRLNALRVVSIPVAAALVAAVGLMVLAGPPQAIRRVRISLADQLLRSAAASAAARPAVKPRPDQWIYSSAVSDSLGARRSRSENWVQFDGRREAYYQAGGLIVHHLPVPASEGRSPIGRFLSAPTTATAYAALASLPAQPDRLLQDVARHASASDLVGSGWDPAGDHFTGAQLKFGFLAVLLWEAAQAAPPHAQANVFRAMSRIPGVHAERGIHDALGRPAVALWITGVQQQLLLDPSTFQVTGQRTLSDGRWPAPGKSGRNVPKGRVVESMAWAKVKLVGKPGER